jgi:hypothetical protein
MRTSILFLSAAISLGSASVPVSACNARGEFCGYPGWAGNAFASDVDRVPDYWREGVVPNGYLAPGYGYVAPNMYVSAYGYAPADGNVRAYGYAPANGYAPGRAYAYGPAYGYAPAYGSGRIAPGNGYVERRYRWREAR